MIPINSGQIKWGMRDLHSPIFALIKSDYLRISATAAAEENKKSDDDNPDKFVIKSVAKTIHGINPPRFLIYERLSLPL